MRRDSFRTAAAFTLLSCEAEIPRPVHGRHTPGVSITGGSRGTPAGSPRDPGRGSGTLSSRRKPGRSGVAEGQAGARAGGRGWLSSGVKTVFTSAMLGWTRIGGEAQWPARCPRPGQGQRKRGQGTSQARGLVLRLDTLSPPRSLCGHLQAISRRVPRLRPVAPGRLNDLARGPSDPLPLPSHSVHPELCVARMRRLSTPQQSRAVRGQGGGQG